jgi:glycosidase
LKSKLLILSWLCALGATALASKPFLGPIHVQFVNAGDELVLDMHRFYEPGDGTTLKAEGATFDPAKAELRVRVNGDRSGLIDLPINVTGGDVALKGVLTIAVVPPHSHLFTFKPDTKPQRVFLAGSFNSWSTDSTPMTERDGVFEARVPLKPGSYQYKFHVDGKWVPDPANPNKTSDGFGGSNSVLEIAGEKKGREPFLYADKKTGDGVEIAVINSEAKLKTISAVVEEKDGQTRKIEPAVEDARLRISKDALPAEGWLRVIAADAEGNISNVVRFPIEGTKTFHWQDAVMYFAMTDRFSDGDDSNDQPDKNPNVLPQANYQGGDWSGMRKKIEEGYFDKLGINTLWIAPVNRNPDKAYREYPEPRRWYTGYHGYWPISPTETDPRFGTAAELKALVKTAHERGIKVLADLVLHHVHEEHPWWKEHRDWFGTLELPDGRKNLRLWDEHQFTTWFEPYLPSFDFEKNEAVQALIDNSVWWAKEYDLDGFRLDAVKHIRQSFWPRFRSALRDKIPRPLYLVGETFKDRAGIDSFVGPNMLDGQFDFPLYDEIKNTFAQGTSTMEMLDTALAQSERVFGKDTPMSPLVGNHDKARFMAYADGDVPDPKFSREEEIGWQKPPEVNDPKNYAKLQLAHAFLFSIDGVPMVYYGDEIGMTGAGDPDNRREMRFGDKVKAEEKAVLENFEKLTHIRSKHPALRYGSRRVVDLDKDAYAFVRTHFDDRAVCIFNRGTRERSFALDVAPELADGEYSNLLDDRSLTVKDGKLTVSVPARSAAIVAKP